jgi:hypothetical protein
MRFERNANSPPAPDAEGIVLVPGPAYVDSAGVPRRMLLGSYALEAFAPACKLVVVLVVDGAPQLYTARAEAKAPPAPAGFDQLVGGYFDVELRGDFPDVAPSQAVHVFAQCGAVRSDVLSVAMPPRSVPS